MLQLLNLTIFILELGLTLNKFPILLIILVLIVLLGTFPEHLFLQTLNYGVLTDNHQN